jgi:hypothetical protein
MPRLIQQTAMTSEPAHAVVSPSAFFRIKNCPGHLWDTKGLPDKETKYSKDGTEIHEWAATALRMALKGVSPDGALANLEAGWKRDIAAGWVEFCVGIVSRIRAVADKTPVTYIEERVRLSELTYGTTDFALSFVKDGKDFLIVCDLKTGSGHHHYARDEDGTVNDQMSLYTLCLAASKGLSPEKVWMYIYQPTVHEDGHDRTVVTPEELDEKLAEVRSVEKKVLRIMEEGPKPSDYKVGKWCNNFCKVFASCKHFRRHVKGEALEDLDDLSPTKPVSELPVNKVPLEKLLSAYAMKSQIEDWLKDIEHYLMERLLKGDKAVSKHYKLVRGRSHSKWKSDTKEVAAGLKKLGVKSPFQEELITITEAKRRVPKEKHEKLLKLTEQNPPKTQLAVLSDPREAVGSNREDLNELEEMDDDRGKPKRVRARAKRGAKKASSNGKKSRR